MSFRIFLNLIPIKKGGGQQVAVNFLNILLNNEFSEYSFFITATKDTVLANLLINQTKYEFKLISKNKIKRFLFESLEIPKLLKSYQPDIIFSLFSPGINHESITSVSGVALSNLFFPEIDFWKGNLFYRLKKKLIDYYRLRAIRRSDALIFENKSMEERGREIYGLKKTTFIRPSISVNIQEPSNKVFDQISQIDPEKFNIIMLTGPHPNKKVDAVVQILKELFILNERDIDFVISISPIIPFAQKIIAQATKYKVHNNIKFIGTVLPQDVFELTKNIHAFLLLSLLESFSNNIIEAWTYNKPLVVTDALWSRSICNDAALYVDRENNKDIANKLISLKNDLSLQQGLSENGKREIVQYPGPKEKVTLQLEYLHQIYDQLKV